MDHSQGYQQIQSILEVAPPVKQRILDVINDELHASSPVMMLHEHAVHASKEVLAGRLTSSDARFWARFLLSRRDVDLEPGFELLLIDFFEDWSFPDYSETVDNDLALKWIVVLGDSPQN